jgi:hypothetical protein
MTVEESCRWRMLPALPRSNCSHSSSGSDSLMWWLADPLWLQEGNDRWTEHLARRVLQNFFMHHLELLIAHGYTTRGSKSGRGWSAERLPVLATRYGVYFLNVWLDVAKPRVRRGEPRLVELWDLSGPRYEFLPLEPARFDRVSSTDSSQLAAWPAPFPKGGGSCRNRDCLTRPGSPLLAAQRMFTSRGLIRNETQPWLGSAEAYGRHQRFDRVTDFQVVTMPRDSGRKLIASYATGSTDLRGSSGVAYSRSPTDSIIRMIATARSSNVVRVSGVIPREGGVISLEAIADQGQAWRHRYFLQEDRECCVSRIAFLQSVTSVGETQAARHELPLELLLPRQWLHTSDRVAFYWEVVGAPSNVDAALEFKRLDQSAWGQVSGLFRRTADGRSVRVDVGTLAPLVTGTNYSGYSLPFALTSLQPGRYEVRAVVRAGTERLERSGAPTEFVLRR